MNQTSSKKQIFITLFFLISVLFGCNKVEKKRILFINSYHQGYPSSDQVVDGVRENLPTSQYVLKTFYMNTKNHPEEDSVSRKTKSVLEMINHSYRPDLVIACDDNAVKDVVVPCLKGGKIPVVFCGVNWSCAQYGLPAPNVTGMLEVLPLSETIATMKKYYPEAHRLFVLSENSLSERNNKQLLDTLFSRMGFTTEYSLVENFEQWKRSFREAMGNSDLIYLPTNGAIKNWNKSEAINFVRKNISKPVITCDDFMMPYAVFGMTKVAKEQGIWAAHTAIKILNGTTVSDIPVTHNQQSREWLNENLARLIGFMPSKKLEEQCELIKYN